MRRQITRSSQLRKHKATGQAVVTLRDHTTLKRKGFYCGPWGSPESIEIYARLIRVWKSGGGRGSSEVITQVDQHTVGEVLIEFWRWAKDYYADGEVNTIRAAIRVIRDLYASTPADAFTPKRLEHVRDEMITKGWPRKSINRQVSRVRQVFNYGVRKGLVPVEVSLALKTVPALRRGKSDAKESKPVRPVPQSVIDATLPHLSAPVAAMVRVQLLTGARSGELVIMRPCDVDREGNVWSYKPTEHKTAPHEHERTIYIGPEAQNIINPLLTNRPPNAFVFSPLDAQGKPVTTARRTRYTPTT
jgi:integrase